MQQIIAGLIVLLAAPAAFARSDLEVTLTAPASVGVYQNARYDIDIDNIGNRHAQNVQVQIDLPETSTSPSVHVMGILGAMSSECYANNTQIICDLGRIRKNRGETVFFEIALPESLNALDFDITATTTSRENTLTNNSVMHSANMTYVSTPISGPAAAHNRHCTGQNLQGFYECTLFPGSISSHDIILEANGTVSFVPPQPGYAGTWSQAQNDELTFSYTYNGGVVANFAGFGVGNDCFEGMTMFVPNNGYSAPYEVCL